MKNKYELVVFDLDGTLLDTSEGILASAIYAIEQMGFEVPNTEVLKSFIGPPIQKSFQESFGVSGDELDRMSNLFRNRYKDVDLLKAKPYDGIYECLQSLHDAGIACAVATYKREDYALKLLNEYGFDKYMKVMHGSDFEGKLSKSDIIQLCIDECGVIDKSTVLMVGDTMGDAHGAQEVGIDFWAVTYGFGFKNEEKCGYMLCDRTLDITERVITE